MFVIGAFGESLFNCICIWFCWLNNVGFCVGFIDTLLIIDWIKSELILGFGPLLFN